MRVRLGDCGLPMSLGSIVEVIVQARALEGSGGRALISDGPHRSYRERAAGPGAASYDAFRLERAPASCRLQKPSASIGPPPVQKIGRKRLDYFDEVLAAARGMGMRILLRSRTGAMADIVEISRTCTR